MPADQNHDAILGQVALVGAGPGDPELLTLKAMNRIREADVILFDALVSPAIRELFPEHVPALYVGKRKGEHSIAQELLNEFIAAKARQGLNVCRIKGGDAFVFGRGGEEMLHLRSLGIRVEVVPGITAASGCTTYAGMPLTHRGLAQGCTFITAHAEKTLDVDWSALARLEHTLVFYMGVSKAGWIADKLMEGGLSGSTPAAFIEQGCTPEQRVVIGELDELQELSVRANVQAPALIVVGQVVSLTDRLSWFVSVDGFIASAEENHQKKTLHPIQKLSA